MSPLFNPPSNKVKIISVNADYQATGDDGTILVDSFQLNPAAVNWNSLTNATASGSEVHNTAGGTSYAVNTTQSLKAGDDGYLEFAPTQANVTIFVGFSATVSPPSLDFSLVLTDTGHIQCSEDPGVDITTYVAGDTLKILRTAGVFTYYKNGVLIYTSLTSNDAKYFATAQLTGAAGTGLNSATTTSQGVTITLPSMTDSYDSGTDAGQCITVYKTKEHGTVTIASSDQIEGHASVAVKEVNDSITTQPNGTTWFLIGAGSLSNTGKTYIRDGLGTRAVDIGGSGVTTRNLLDQRGNPTVDFNLWTLYETLSSPLGSISIVWGFRNLLDTTGNIAFDWNDGLAPIMAYNPAVPGDWTPAPVTVAEALDQLAARVKALEP